MARERRIPKELRNTIDRKWKRIDLTIPEDLLHRLKLVRAITGIPMAEWTRTQVRIACDLELARRPGALFMRPGSKVYRLDWGGEEEVPVPVHIATTDGGERVWVREVLADFPIAKEDDGVEWGRRMGAVLCDLSPEDGMDGLMHRNVAVASADVLPKLNPYTTGLGQKLEKRRRQTVRRNQAHRKARRIRWMSDRSEGEGYRPYGKLGPKGEMK